MKKLLIVALAALCCVAFSAPAFAEIKVGGMISTEQFWWDRSKERVAGGVLNNATTAREKLDTVEFAMGQAWNRVNVQYISDDKKIGGMLELRTGGQKGGGNAVSPTANPTGESNFVWELAYIDWHFNPNFYLRVGRQTQTFAIYSPDQQMGHNHGHIVLVNFGNIHGGTSREGVRAYIKFNDMVRMEIQAINPDTDVASSLTDTGADKTFWQTPELLLPRKDATAAFTGTTAGTFADEENKIPRFDISLPIKFANFNVEPSFSWLRQEYSAVAAGSDDSFDIWGIALGAKAGFGPFTISGEGTYGRNLGAGNYVGASLNGAPVAYMPATAAGVATGNAWDRKFEDTKIWAGWVQAEFNFGPFAIQGIVGYQNSKNDGNPDISRDAAEFDVTRWAYGIQFPVNIAKNFKVVPQFWYYDYGDENTLGGAAGTAQRNGIDTDSGSEITAGLFWQLTF